MAEESGGITTIQHLPVPLPLPISVSGTDARPIVDLLSSFRDSGATKALRGLSFPVLIPRAHDLGAALSSMAHPLPSMRGKSAPAWSRLGGEITRLYVGRAATNAIVVDDLSVSRLHASIVRHENGSWSLVDEGGLNGTFLDGERLKPCTSISLPRKLATIRLGPEVELMVMHELVFADYLRSFLSDLDEHELGLATPSPTTQTRRLSDSIRRTLPGSARQDPLAAAILRATREAPFPARRYQVVLEDALVEDFATWPALVTFIERNARRVVAVEARWDSNRDLVVYRRERDPARAGSHPVEHG